MIASSEEMMRIELGLLTTLPSKIPSISPSKSPRTKKPTRVRKRSPTVYKPTASPSIKKPSVSPSIPPFGSVVGGNSSNVVLSCNGTLRHTSEMDVCCPKYYTQEVLFFETVTCPRFEAQIRAPFVVFASFNGIVLLCSWYWFDASKLGSYVVFLMGAVAVAESVFVVVFSRPFVVSILLFWTWFVSVALVYYIGIAGFYFQHEVAIWNLCFWSIVLMLVFLSMSVSGNPKGYKWHSFTYLLLFVIATGCMITSVFGLHYESEMIAGSLKVLFFGIFAYRLNYM
jgi:hypothetical protein